MAREGNANCTHTLHLKPLCGLLAHLLPMTTQNHILTFQAPGREEGLYGRNHHSNCNCSCVRVDMLWTI